MKKIVSYIKDIFSAMKEAVGQYHSYRAKNKSTYL
jgi:hypothetical protein